MLILFFGILFNGCNKSTTSTITGKWNVISDSEIISGGAVSYNIYHGATDDYFVFAPDNILYIKEALTYDTILYKLTSANTMSLVQTGVFNAIPETGNYMFTGDKVRIAVTPDLLNPGFSYKRVINLRR